MSGWAVEVSKGTGPAAPICGMKRRGATSQGRAYPGVRMAGRSVIWLRHRDGVAPARSAGMFRASH